MKTFAVTVTTTRGRQQICVIAACSVDALLSTMEKFHGESLCMTVTAKGKA